MRGWFPGTSGDLSVALQDDPIELLITRSGCSKRDLTVEDLVTVGLDGKPIEGETRTPSTEAQLHALVAALTDAGSVLHTHSVWNTLVGQRYLAAGGFVVSEFGTLKALRGVDTHSAEVFVPVVGNSEDLHALAEAIRELFTEWPSAPCFLIAGHGMFTWGATLPQARIHVETVEFLLECIGRTIPATP